MLKFFFAFSGHFAAEYPMISGFSAGIRPACAGIGFP